MISMMMMVVVVKVMMMSMMMSMSMSMISVCIVSSTSSIQKKCLYPLAALRSYIMNPSEDKIFMKVNKLTI